jgi:hypothetical protein
MSRGLGRLERTILDTIARSAAIHEKMAKERRLWAAEHLTPEGFKLLFAETERRIPVHLSAFIAHVDCYPRPRTEGHRPPPTPAQRKAVVRAMHNIGTASGSMNPLIQLARSGPSWPCSALATTTSQ